MEVFFYGLFMDESVFKENGINPLNSRKGHLNNYKLKIGNRASLVPSFGDKAYGLIMDIPENTIRKLYSEKSVADYIPEEVIIVTEDNDSVLATCFNLPLESITGTNVEYAKSLFKLAKKNHFPAKYLESIENMTKS